jgi:epoxide hydrolase-like predicted phosphatase
VKKALLTDFGGVLTTNVFDAFRSFAVSEGLDPDAVRTTFREQPEALAGLRRLERGEVSVEEFEQGFAAALGVADHGGIVKRLFAGVGPDEPMVAAVRRIHAAGVTTAVVSNSWGDATYDAVSWDGLFDEIVISGEVGLHKPEPAIFELACERVGFDPGECVFVDDLRENCAGAEAVGITAVLHRGADTTIPELERLFGLPLR